MRPKQSKTTGEGDLFRARLDQIINLKHELVQFGARIDWDWIGREVAPLYSDESRPAIAGRFLIGYCCSSTSTACPTGASASAGCTTRISSTSPALSFPHEFPHERSDLSHWRKWLGDQLELLLAESLRLAHEISALRTQDLKQVTVGTTVQPKAISFLTDAKLVQESSCYLSRWRAGCASIASAAKSAVGCRVVRAAAVVLAPIVHFTPSRLQGSKTSGH